jgi:hypothetical protein
MNPAELSFLHGLHHLSIEIASIAFQANDLAGLKVGNAAFEVKCGEAHGVNLVSRFCHSRAPDSSFTTAKLLEIA